LLAKLLLVTAAAALPLVATAAPAQAGKQMEVALQDDGVFLYGEHFDRDQGYRHLRALGVTHLRMNMLWWQPLPLSQRNSTTTPSNIRYDFGVWDSAINRARDFGIKVQLDLTGDPPAFACGSKQLPYACDGFKPDRALFAHFVRAVVAHFKGRVSRYSLWNEPNWYTWISPHKQSPLLYRRLYEAGYEAAKEVDPGAEIVMGELAPHFQPRISMPPLEFIRKMVCVNDKLKRTRNANRKCGREPLKFDAFSTHPYDFTNRPTRRRENPDELTMANINALPRLLNRLRRKGLVAPTTKKFPIYLTEHGYFVAGRRGVPEKKRARWITQAWQMALDAPRVKQQLHYVLVSPPADSPSSYFDMGLMSSNGVFRPSYDALRGWVAAHAGSLQRPGPCSTC
jgi:hypothetical protein